MNALPTAESANLHFVTPRFEWDDEQTFAERAPHVRYLHPGMDDAGQAVPPEWFERRRLGRGGLAG